MSLCVTHVPHPPSLCSPLLAHTLPATPTTSSCTHPGPFPHEGDLGPLAIEERGVVGWEVWILKQDALLCALLPQLLEALA